MIESYRKAKEAAPDCLVCCKVGDNYATLFGDAIAAGGIMGKPCGTHVEPGHHGAPVAYFPAAALDAFTAKAIAAGYRVALCEPMESAA